MPLCRHTYTPLWQASINGNTTLDSHWSSWLLPAMLITSRHTIVIYTALSHHILSYAHLGPLNALLAWPRRCYCHAMLLPPPLSHATITKKITATVKNITPLIYATVTVLLRPRHTTLRHHARYIIVVYINIGQREYYITGVIIRIVRISASYFDIVTMTAHAATRSYATPLRHVIGSSRLCQYC